ncbi:MAG: heparan-alpha-glucosaminide N-acetyltransferase domain-containing protein [Ginsengibacter sp.]
MLTLAESKGLALARGIIVFLIAPIHCVMVYSTPEVKHGPLGKFMAFFAENPGAHLFMFLMGAFVALSRKKSCPFILKRFFLLLTAGWLLNIFKFVIPHLFDLLPQNFYSENQFVRDKYIALRFLFINDILQFAAFAYMICALIRRSSSPILITTVAGLATLILSPFMWDKGTTGNLFFNVFVDLLGGFPPNTYFPLFPWLYHCLSGMMFGLLLQRNYLNRSTFLFIGIVLTMIGHFISEYEPEQWNITFFRAGWGGTIFHNGVTILWISLFFFIRKHVPNNLLFHFFEWCSDHITSIYLVQWCIIMWLLPLVGYENSGIWESLALIIVISIASLFIAKSITKKQTLTNE